MPVYFAKNLLLLRGMAKLSQEKTAAALGLKRSTYANYESGAVPPYVELIESVVQLFGVDAQRLLFEELNEGNLISKNQDKEKEVKGKVYGKVSGKDLLVLDESTPTLTSRMNVYDLESRAAAGQALLLTNNDKLKPAPNMYLPGLGFGLHIRITITGDSMGDLFGDGDKIVATHVQSIKELREGHPHIVIDAEDGVVFKRLYNTGHKTLEFVSDNSMYKPYRRSLGDILAIFKYREHHSMRTEPADIGVRRELREMREEMSAIWDRLGR